MKKLSLFLVAFIIFLVGCSNSSIDTSGKLIAPQNKFIPVSGKWKIVEELGGEGSSSSKGNVNNLIGKAIQFSKQYVRIGNYVLQEPSYKIRKVNFNEYMLFTRKSFLKNFNIKSKEIEIVTITSREAFLCEIIRLSEDKLVLNIENNSFYLQKISDKVDGNLPKGIKGNIDFLKEDDLTRTGLVLGLRYPSGSISQGETKYKYRTLWIGAKNKKIHSILENKDIIFPRRNGFWKIDVGGSRISPDDNAINAYNIAANGLSRGASPILASKAEDMGLNNIIINYVCNDYIGIETTGTENILRVVPIDSLPVLRGVKISDLAGPEGADAMRNAMENQMLNKKINSIIPMDEENFGLIRKMGHWFLKGRVNKSLNDYVDFDIKIVPSSRLVFYDNLNVTWTEIKNRVPMATDAYTSPNGDIAVVLTKDKLFIYAVNNGKLEDTPLRKLQLNTGETVIMAEWATGSYAEGWEKVFLNIK